MSGKKKRQKFNHPPPKNLTEPNHPKKLFTDHLDQPRKPFNDHIDQPRKLFNDHLDRYDRFLKQKVLYSDNQAEGDNMIRK